jgi:hypothetical protein
MKKVLFFFFLPSSSDGFAEHGAITFAALTFSKSMESKKIERRMQFLIKFACVIPSVFVKWFFGR